MSATPGKRASDADIRQAIEVFARGFSVTRSVTFPFEPTRFEGVWVLRDAERKNPRDYRREEWIAFGKRPADVDRIARANTRGRFVICAIRSMDRPMPELRDAYKSIGYRLQGTEPLFVHDLARIASVTASAVIQRVQSLSLAEQLAKASRSRPLSAICLASDGPMRSYAAMVDDQIVGWVSSIVVKDRNWVSNLYVKESHRRCGIGRALMVKMLRDDRAGGSRASVLLASHTGAKLYPLVGYRQIGELLLLIPPRPRNSCPAPCTHP